MQNPPHDPVEVQRARVRAKRAVASLILHGGYEDFWLTTDTTLCAVLREGLTRAPHMVGLWHAFRAAVDLYAWSVVDRIGSADDLRRLADDCEAALPGAHYVR